MLRPEEREDGELEVVRFALEQFVDTGVLSVCKTELTVDGLFRDGAQDISLAPPPDGLPELGQDRWCEGEHGDQHDLCEAERDRPERLLEDR